MANFIEEKNEEITATCLRYGIKRLFVLDLFFEMTLDLEKAIWTFLLNLAHWKLQNYFHAFLDAREVFRKIFQADVDLAMQDAVKDKIILKEIDRAKRLLYGA